MDHEREKGESLIGIIMNIHVYMCILCVICACVCVHTIVGVVYTINERAQVLRIGREAQIHRFMIHVKHTSLLFNSPQTLE